MTTASTVHPVNMNKGSSMYSQFPEQHLSFIKKVARIRNEVAILKDSEARLPKYSYSYAKLQDIVAELNPVLDKAGLFYHWVVNDNLITVRVIDTENGCYIESSIRISEENFSDFQDIGSCLTYYSRYLLLLIFGIVAQEDDGSVNDVPHQKKSKSKTKSRRSSRKASVPEDEDDEEDDDDGDDYDDEDEDDDDGDDDDDEPPRRSARRSSSNRRSSGTSRRRGLPTRSRR